MTTRSTRSRAATANSPLKEKEETCSCKCVTRIKSLEEKLNDLKKFEDKINDLEKFEEKINDLEKFEAKINGLVKFEEKINGLEKIEDKINDLVNLKNQVDKFQALLDSLLKSGVKSENVTKKDDPEPKLPSSTQETKVAAVIPAQKASPSHQKNTSEPKSEPIKEKASSRPVVTASFDDDDDNDEPMTIPEVEIDENDFGTGCVEPPPIDASNGVENVEITPDFFGHFLLDNDGTDMGMGDDDIQMIPEDEVENLETAPREKRKRRLDRRYDDSDSEDCYELSDSDEVSSEDISSDDDYMPQNKRGRGRGRGRSSREYGAGYRPHNNTMSSHPPSATAKVGPQAAQTKPILDLDTRNELIKNCKKRPGDIWECKVCGFMLSSLENMLLHVKYNHSTTTHTCPFCKVVVLCRSPKDALMHQVQCKLRPQGSKCRAPKSTLEHLPTQRPNPSAVATSMPSAARSSYNNSSSNSYPYPTVGSRKQTVAEIDDKVNQFVSDLLEPSSSKSKPPLMTAARRKQVISPTPAVVTLSSDEEEDEDSDSDSS